MLFCVCTCFVLFQFFSSLHILWGSGARMWLMHHYRQFRKKINSVFPALAAGKSERLIVSVWTFLITISSLYFCLCEHTLPNRWWAAYPAAGDGGWVVGYCGASLVVSLIFHYIDITVVLFRCCQNSQLISTLAYYTSSLPDRQQNQHRAATGRWKLLFHYIR